MEDETLNELQEGGDWDWIGLIACLASSGKRSKDLVRAEPVKSETVFLQELEQSLTRRKTICWETTRAKEMTDSMARLKEASQPEGGAGTGLVQEAKVTPDFTITLELLAFLAAHPNMKERFIEESRYYSSMIKAVRLHFDDSLIKIQDSIDMPSDIKILQVATSLGQHFGSLPNLGTAIISFDDCSDSDDGSDSSRNILLLTAFLGCRQVKTLLVDGEEYIPSDESIATIGAFIQGNPVLEEVKIKDHSQFHDTIAFLRPLASLTRLTSLDIANALIDDTETAHNLQRVLELESLTKVHLRKLDVETEDARRNGYHLPLSCGVAHPTTLRR